MNTPEAGETAVLEVVRALRERWWVLALSVVGVAVLVFVYTAAGDDQYAATAEVRISDPYADSVFAGDAGAAPTDEAVGTQQQIITSQDVLDQAAEGQNAATEEAIEDVTTSRVEATTIIRIRATSTDPSAAQEAANAVAASYIELSREQASSGLTRRVQELLASAFDLQATINDLDDRIAAGQSGSPAVAALQDERAAVAEQQREFRRRASELEVESAVRDGGVELVEAAEQPDSPFAPTPARDALVAALITSALVAAGIVVMDRFDESVKSREQFNRPGIDLPLLAEIPAQRRPRRPRRPAERPGRELVSTPAQVEAYKGLQTNLRFSTVGREHHVVGITSAIHAEGKSTVAANLAVTLSAAGFDTAVIGLDLYRPTLGEFFAVSDSGPGVTSVLIKEATPADIALPLPHDGTGRLVYYPSGHAPPNPTPLLESVVMQDFLATVSAGFDYVIVDCPPVLPVADTVVLSKHLSGLIITAKHGYTRESQLRHCLERLDQVNARVIGGVLTAVPESRHPGYYADSDDAKRT